MRYGIAFAVAVLACTSANAAPFGDTQKRELLAAQNRYRAEIGVPPLA